MGTVYRARDRASGKYVALKLMREASESFESEARLLRELDHPSIVRYVAHGVADAGAYLVMEWLDGHDLDSRLGRGRFAIDNRSEGSITRVAHLKKLQTCFQRGASESRTAVRGLACAGSDDTSLLADARWFVIREALSRAVITGAARLDRRRLAYVGARTARSRFRRIRRAIEQRRVVIGPDLTPARSNGEKPTQFGVMHSGPHDSRRTSA